MKRSAIALWCGIILSLSLNLALLYSLNLARGIALDALTEIDQLLQALESEIVVYDVAIDQVIPVKASIPFKRTMEIPIDTVIPIDRTLAVPVQTAAGEIPLEIPLQLDFPIAMTVPIDLDENIAIDTDIHLNTVIPVKIDIATTPLVDYLHTARSQLAGLRTRLAFGWSPTSVSTLSVAQTVPVLQTQAEQAATATPQPTRGSTSTPVVVNLPFLAPQSQASPEPSLCEHAYWPLRSGTRWAYASDTTSYTYHVANILNNQVDLVMHDQGRAFHLNMICYEEGLGGPFVGDIRPLMSLGKLQLANREGLFLPHPSALEVPDATWQQRLDISGTLEGVWQNQLVAGHITQGEALAGYKVTGSEIIDTPLGAREALIVQQTVTLILAADFVLTAETVSITREIKVANRYWFAKGIGLVRNQWEGGSVQQPNGMGARESHHPIVIPAIAAEDLAFVCILPINQPNHPVTEQCKYRTGLTEADLPLPAQAELTIPALNLLSMATEATVELTQTITVTNEGITTTDDVVDLDNQAGNDNSALIRYTLAVTILSERVAAILQAFSDASYAYQVRQITREAFHASFLLLKSDMADPIAQFEQLKPPLEAEAIHQQLLTGLDQCSQALVFLESWFDTGDRSAGDTGLVLATTCISTLSQARDDLTSINDAQ